VCYTAPVIEAARALAPRIRALADETERGRRLPAELVEAFHAAGFFHMCVPRLLGGGEVAPATMLGVLEELGRADGAAGWCAMIAATSGVLAAYLAPETAKEIYGGARGASGGAFAPYGKAVAADGGYRVNGRWPFASGCEHCTWLMGGCVVEEQGKPKLLPNGVPNIRLMLFPAAAARIIDTWDVSGLRGTGSHDISVENLLVPAAHSASLITDQPTAAGALYVFPVFGLLALGIAAVALGIGRRAIDELTALAAKKTPALTRRRLAERGAIQVEVAAAEATLAAARAYLFGTVEEMWTAAQARGEMTLAQRAALRLTASHAVSASVSAADRMYTAGGGSAIYSASPLQRCFRDLHVATQHTMVNPATFELVGRVLLGVEADTAML